MEKQGATLSHAVNPILVNRRQKRLRYWQERFKADGAHPDRIHEVREKLNTFALLLSKLVKAENDSQLQESETRLETLERELTALFEARRLLTSSIGVPAVGE